MAELLGPGRVVHHGTRRAQAIDVEDEPFRAAACGHQLDFGELVGDHLQPHHQQHGRPGFLHHDMGTCHAGALVDDVLAEATQTRHRAGEADLRDRLLDGILGHAQRVGDGQAAHVVLQQRIQQLRHLAAQAFAVTGGRGRLRRRVRCGTPRATGHQQSHDRPVRHLIPSHGKSGILVEILLLITDELRISAAIRRAMEGYCLP